MYLMTRSSIYFEYDRCRVLLCTIDQLSAKIVVLTSIIETCELQFDSWDELLTSTALKENHHRLVMAYMTASGSSLARFMTNSAKLQSFLNTSRHIVYATFISSSYASIARLIVHFAMPNAPELWSTLSLVCAFVRGCATLSISD